MGKLHNHIVLDKRFLEQDGVVDRAKDSLFYSAIVKVYEASEPGTWYKMRYSFFEHERPDDLEIMFSMDFDEIPQEIVRIRTAEEIFLTPQKTIRQKLKRCMMYLKDKKGGETYVEPVNKNK